MLNEEFRFLFSIIDIFSEYAWVVPLKQKEGVSIVNAFQKILDQSGRKPNKIWVDKGSEFYNNSFKKMIMILKCIRYITKERFIRTLKTKICKYMTSTSKNVYINKLDDIVNEYNNTYHITIKTKPVDIKNNAYIDSNS